MIQKKKIFGDLAGLKWDFMMSQLTSITLRNKLEPRNYITLDTSKVQPKCSMHFRSFKNSMIVSLCLPLYLPVGLIRVLEKNSMTKMNLHFEISISLHTMGQHGKKTYSKFAQNLVQNNVWMQKNFHPSSQHLSNLDCIMLKMLWTKMLQNLLLWK